MSHMVRVIHRYPEEPKEPHPKPRPFHREPIHPSERVLPFDDLRDSAVKGGLTDLRLRAYRLSVTLVLTVKLKEERAPLLPSKLPERHVGEDTHQRIG